MRIEWALCKAASSAEKHLLHSTAVGINSTLLIYEKSEHAGIRLSKESKMNVDQSQNTYRPVIIIVKSW